MLAGVEACAPVVLQQPVLQLVHAGGLVNVDTRGRYVGSGGGLAGWVGQEQEHSSVILADEWVD